ncbi:hypothetical protein LDENG_00176470 [Lucifuga dentata]|nr:hypothetical protein LDENG_00176470 [Lucifuga dentata]
MCSHLHVFRCRWICPRCLRRNVELDRRREKLRRHRDRQQSNMKMTSRLTRTATSGRRNNICVSAKPEKYTKTMKP